MNTIQFKRKDILVTTGVVFVVAMGILLFFFNPEQVSFYPPCILKKFTGWDCPGCGSTRAMHALLHGNIRAAADYNLLLIVLLPAIVLGLADQFGFKTMGAWKMINKPLVFCVLVCLFWILRNIDLAPFTYLNSSR